MNMMKAFVLAALHFFVCMGKPTREITFSCVNNAVCTIPGNIYQKNGVYLPRTMFPGVERVEIDRFDENSVLDLELLPDVSVVETHDSQITCDQIINAIGVLHIITSTGTTDCSMSNLAFTTPTSVSMALQTSTSMQASTSMQTSVSTQTLASVSTVLSSTSGTSVSTELQTSSSTQTFASVSTMLPSTMLTPASVSTQLTHAIYPLIASTGGSLIIIIVLIVYHKLKLIRIKHIRFNNTSVQLASPSTDSRRSLFRSLSDSVLNSTSQENSQGQGMHVIEISAIDVDRNTSGDSNIRMHRYPLRSQQKKKSSA